MNTFHREITPLSKDDSFLVFDRIKDTFDFPIHYHPEYEINFILNVLYSATRWTQGAYPPTQQGYRYTAPLPQPTYAYTPATVSGQNVK